MKIGLLSPRSTDYPAMAFDLLDGLRCSLAFGGAENIQVVPENIGFGEDRKVIYAKAEKLLMQDNAAVVVAYLSAVNAALLYPLFEAAGKPLIVLDAGMNYPVAPPSKQALFISLQGIHASYLAGKKGAAGGKNVIMATSFYDGGYGGPWAYTKGLEASGGAVVDNYVSHYKEEEFTIAPFTEAVATKQEATVMACFSTYLASLFLNKLPAESVAGKAFYCSSFMAEEQNMASYNLPDAQFYAYVPWASALEQESNTAFKKFITEQKGKTANIFHLMGCEAGIVTAHLLKEGGTPDTGLTEMLNGWSYESPRGMVTVHPETHIAYAPLYFAEMTQDAGEKARINVHHKMEISAEEHLDVINNQPEGVTSGWFNNYLCT